MNEGSFYEVMIMETVTGPHSLRDLKDMESRKEIDELTQVRSIPNGDWCNWGEVEARFRLYFRQWKRQEDPTFSQVFAVAKSDRSRGVFIIIGLLFGCFGFHNFYAGHYNKGFAEFFGMIIGIATTLAVPAGVVIIFGIAITALVEVMVVTDDGEGRPLS